LTRTITVSIASGGAVGFVGLDVTQEHHAREPDVVRRHGHRSAAAPSSASAQSSTGTSMSLTAGSCDRLVTASTE
jgi:hypothetical protein